MAQLHFNKWLDIADVFEAFSCKIGDSQSEVQTLWYKSGGRFFHNE